MTALHTRDKNETPHVDPTKDGEYHDRCPRDGCMDVDRQFKNGGTTGRGEEHLNWSMYHANPREGGCGYTWARTTKQGLAEDHSKGVATKWGTQSAEVGRSYSLPTQQFRDKFDSIDWSK